MRNILILFIGFSLSFASMATELPRDKREYLLENLPLFFKNSWEQPEIKACWNAGVNGDDHALSALFVMYKSAELIDKNTQMTKEFYQKNIVNGKFKGRISDLLKQRDHNKLRKVVKMMPKAIKYCESYVPKEMR